MQLARQRVFQVAPVEQPCQGIMGGLCVLSLAQHQVGQRQLDRFAHHYGQLSPADLLCPPRGGSIDDTQQPQYFTLHDQWYTHVVGLSLMDEMTAPPYLRISDFMRATAPQGPTIFH